MTKSVLIIGAGIIGASVALQLTKSGCEVTIIDSLPVGGLATGNSFAWINASWGNPEFYFHFRRRSMAGWRRLAREVDGIGVDFCGGLLWDLPAEELEAYAAEHESWGYGIRRVDAREAREIEPGLVSPPQFALHVAEEGMVEPSIAARAMLRAAGLSVTRARASELVLHGRKVAGVMTDLGVMKADEVVVAAGARTASLLATAGVTLAMDDPAGLIAHSSVVEAKLLNGLVLSPDAHIRQTAEGRLIAGADFAGTDPGEHAKDSAEALMATVRSMIRGAENLRLDHYTLGHRPTPADGFPYIGRPKGTEGVYVTLMHSGVTLAPIVGLLAAGEIVRGVRDPMLADYALDRAPLA